MVTDDMWRKTLISGDLDLRTVVQLLDSVALKILLLVDSNQRLIGTISDGDIRRALLANCSLQDSVLKVVHKNPLVVDSNLSRPEVLKLMRLKKIYQIPIVDSKKKVIGLHLWDEVREFDNYFVIMAGGRGERMLPYTKDCPKPMLHVSGKPMLQHIIEKAKLQGFKNFIISTNYLGDTIKDYFRDGKNLDVNIQYVDEKIPLGTAGSLSLISNVVKGSIIVVNGDVLSGVNYADMLDFHDIHQAFATMALREYEWQNPFGVVTLNGVNIIKIEEKPVIKSHVNAGIYVLNRGALDLLRSDCYCDMPTLFDKMKDECKKIIAYPIHEKWLDVGRPDDLFKANNEYSI